MKKFKVIFPEKVMLSDYARLFSHDRGLLALEDSEFNYHTFDLEFNRQHFHSRLFNLWRHLWWHLGVISVLKLMHSSLFIFFAIWTFSVRQRSQYLLPLSYILHFWSMSHLIIGSGPSFSRQTNWERAVWCFIFSFLKEALYNTSVLSETNMVFL